MSLRNLPVTLRVLFSSFLIVIGIGYLMALSYLFLVDIEPHHEEGQGPVEGISTKYHGSADTRLEAALKGTMADKLTPEERDQVFQWIRAGATADEVSARDQSKNSSDTWPYNSNDSSRSRRRPAPAPSEVGQ